MFKESAPNSEPKILRNSAESFHELQPEKIKRLKIIAGAFTAILAGTAIEMSYLHSHDTHDNHANKRNIYLPEEKPEFQDQAHEQTDQPKQTDQVEQAKESKESESSGKAVFVESLPYREITILEQQLEREIPIYGEKAESVKRIIPNKAELKKAPHIPYRHVVDKPGFPDVKAFGKETIYGNESESWQAIEALKYKVITSAVERRYNLPPNLIMAMVIQECGAREFLPNEIGDGGIGLSHMQGETSKSFSLNTICHTLVCNGKNGSCKDSHGDNLNHGQTLKEAINSEKDKAVTINYDFRETLSKLDERFNHLGNLDAVGRMLEYAIANWIPNNKRTGIPDIDNDPLKSAICVYTGTVNFHKYWKNVCVNIKRLENVDTLRNEWNKREHGNTSLDSYLRALQHFNAINYGVKEYMELPCYTTAHSKAVLKSYKLMFPEHDEHFFEYKEKEDNAHVEKTHATNKTKQQNTPHHRANVLVKKR